MNYIEDYLMTLWHLLVDMAPYLLFGFLAAGVLKVYFPSHLLVKYMGGSAMKSSFNASLLGVPMPLCSCGVLPAGISFYRSGASKSATTSFLISTPQTGVDSILVTYAMLGLPMAIIRPIVALLTGFAGGVATSGFDNDKPNNLKSVAEDTTPPSLRTMLRYAFVDFMADISRWLIYGLLVAALIAVVLPDDFFATSVSNPYLQMLAVLFASVPVYVCATGSVPIAAVLLLKGISPGAVLVFLMAGPATNAASLTVLYKTLGRRSTTIYLVTIVAGALLAGAIINLLPQVWFQTPVTVLHDHHHGLLPSWIGIGSAIILIALIANSFINSYLHKTTKTSLPMSNNQILVAVEGMTCNHCVRNVENALKRLEQVKSVQVNLERNEVFIEGENINLDQVQEAVEQVGYTFAGQKPLHP